MAEQRGAQLGAVTPRSSRLWLWLFVGGAAVWALATAITAVTRDTILVPTVILLGSFLVPVTMVAFALSRPVDRRLPGDVLVLGFFAAGTLGVVLSALTETYVLPSAAGTFLAVGLIEEGTKGAVLLLVARRIASRDPRAGMVLGATVGAGFASFESAGYALTAVIGHSDDHPILRIVGTELTRAVLAPFGHITWTALLGGAVFAAAAMPRGAAQRIVLGTFAGVVALHGVWDGSYGLAIMITNGLRGNGWSIGWPNTAAWIGSPSGATLLTFQVVYDGLIAINAALGATWAVRRWRRYGRSRRRAGEAAVPVAGRGP